MTENTTGERARPGGDPPIRSLPGRFVRWLAAQNSFLLMGAFFAMGVAADRTPMLDPYGWVFYLTGGLLPIVLGTVSTEEDAYEMDVSNTVRLKFVVSQLRWAITPWGILTQALQIGGTAIAYVRYLGRLPNRDRHVPETDLTLPFDGEWTTVNGGVTKRTSHSWGIVSQRYAYDFVVTDDDGDTHEGDGEALTDYYAFGQPIRAPADGTVVKTKSKLRDYPRPGTGWLEWRTWDIAGNHVVIEHADGEYSMLAHLREDSITVDPGDEVERGDVIGECGNSGFSSEPHLHFQLQDTRNFWLAVGLVPGFTDLTLSRDDDARTDDEDYDPVDSDPERRRLRAGDAVAPGGERG